MTNLVDAAIKNLRETLPDHYVRFFSRRVDFHHPNYTPVKHLQLSLAAHQLIPPESSIDKTWTIAAEKMAGYKMPVYHITPTFMRAVDLTIPPEDLKPEDLHMPFSAFGINLPKDESRRLFGTTITSIVLMKVGDGELTRVHTLKLDLINEGNKFVVLGACEDTKEGLPIHYAMMAMCEDSFRRLCGEDYYADFTNPLESFEEFSNTAISAEDEKVLPRKLGIFGVKLLAVLNAAPTLYPTPPSELTEKKVKDSSGVSHSYRPPLWIGERYVAKAEKPHPSHPSHPTATSSHASPRMHWRRGHIRRQHYGPKNTQERLLWIEPVLVNKPKEIV